MSDDRVEYYNSTKSKNLELESGFSEYWIAKCINGQRVGEGNCPIDVITPENIGIDVMCLCLNKSITNEKSIIQNFKIGGNSLDNLFQIFNVKEIIDLYKKSLYTKLKSSMEKFNLKSLYYLAFISSSKNVYLSCYKLDIYAIYNISDGLMNSKSITCKNFIDEKYGHVKIYKSKKRMELRFFKHILECSNTIQLF